MLKHFPSKPAVVAEVGKFLDGICADDQEARLLTDDVLEQYSEWCGPSALKQAHADLVIRQRREERKRAWEQARAEHAKERDAHESTCPGYTIRLDESVKVVSVRFCGQGFGEWGNDPNGGCGFPLSCRKGRELEARDPGLCKRLLAEELAARPGWGPYEDYWRRAFSMGKFSTGKHNARM
jgi:hypothetical protein